MWVICVWVSNHFYVYFVFLRYNNTVKKCASGDLNCRSLIPTQRIIVRPKDDGLAKAIFGEEASGREDYPALGRVAVQKHVRHKGTLKGVVLID
jgi:hypothetical protein